MMIKARSKHQYFIFMITILIFINQHVFADKSSELLGKKIRSIKLPACQACKMLVESFTSELHRAIKKFSSSENKGLSDSEEYSIDNERTFFEVFDNLCREDSAKDQCLTLADKCKEDLKKWWLKNKSESSDLLQYLCVDTLRYCCPNDHFGPDCQPCPGHPGRVCNNNGKCKGNGTRKGNGQCSCDVGYTGTMCEDCAASYYASYKDDNKLLCVRCHSACEDDCHQAGPKGCTSCRPGWRMVKNRGCVDVNECFAKRSPCTRNEFCVNNEGSFSCLACDQSCDTCTGDGPDMCDNCAPGYVLKDNMCVNEKTYVSYSDITRYLTYAGLCFATYIVFQNSLLAASAIGICVAIYVTVSEYMLGTLSHVNFLSFGKTMEILENIWMYND